MDMTFLETWWIWSGLSLLVLGLMLAKKQGRIFKRLARNDSVRITHLRSRWATSTHDGERRAIEIALAHIESMQSRWFLDANDLSAWQRSRLLVEQMAAAFHPDSPDPITRARIGPLLDGFLKIKESLVTLTRLPGLGQLARINLRHIETLKSVWQKKKAWDDSPIGRTADRLHLYFLVKWGYGLFRAGDALFWMFKSGGFLVYDLALKRLLINWYLSLAEVALDVYGTPGGDAPLPDDEVLEDMEDLEEPEPSLDEFPPHIRSIVERSRKELLMAPRTLPWAEIEQNGKTLVKDIAVAHHPQSPDPLREARLFDLLLSLSRLCESVSALRSKPVISKVLDLRLSHLMKVKAAADTVMDNQWFDLFKKYKVGSAVKYTSLAYRAFKKGHPGVLFKDIAFTVVQEGGKRWLAIYLHGKVARESNAVYGVKIKD